MTPARGPITRRSSNREHRSCEWTGQALERVDFSPSRGGVLVGRIVDDFDEPVAGARVQAQRYQYGPGNGTIGDDGAFRLAGAGGRVLLRPTTPPGWALKVALRAIAAPSPT